MDNIEIKKIILDLWDIFGEKEQLIIALEELAELQKTITKRLRDINNPDFNFHDMVSELADVCFVIDQLIINYQLQDRVDEMFTHKVKRTKQLMELYKE